MSVQRRLERCKEILLDVAKSRSCVKITQYDAETVRYFTEVLDQVIARYQRESERVKRYGRR